MTFIRFKTRLLIAFWAVLFLALCLPAGYLYHSLETSVVKQTRENAVHHLSFVNWLMQKYAPFNDEKGLYTWCRQVGENLGYRITVIAEDGTVTADSAVPYADIPTLENHAQREEIAAARKGGIAVSIRVSSTVHRRMIYAATRIFPPEMKKPLYLRLAMPVSAMESRLAGYSHHFWEVLAIIFLLTLLVSYYLAHKLESPVQQIIERIQAVGAGDYSHRFIMDSGREFYQISTSMNDMADRIKTQLNVISEQKQELEAIIENMREGIMLLDGTGRIKAINRTLAAIADCHMDCFGKRPLEVFLSPEIQTACDRVLNDVKEYTTLISLDDDMHYEIYSVRIPEGAVMVFYDINERKRLDKIRQDFVANVSHELKTPLTSIKGYVETLITGGFSFPDEVRSFLDTIMKNANQMSNIVNDLLELTRLQEKPFGPKLPPVNAKSCFLAAWETCLPLAEQKEIIMNDRLTGDLTVAADENALVRVFRNLIDNAIRYTPVGKTITVFAMPGEKEIVFALQDEGLGIPAVHQSRIFERFYRVDKERSRASGGTGLGLAICKNAISGMGGRIWVKSPPDNATSGTIFYFSLPKAKKN